MGILIGNNDSTFQSFFITPYFQSRTSLKYNPLLITKHSWSSIFCHANSTAFYVLPQPYPSSSLPPRPALCLLQSPLALCLLLCCPHCLTLSGDWYLLSPAKKTLPAVQGAQAIAFHITECCSSRFQECRYSQRALSLQCGEAMLGVPRSFSFGSRWYKQYLI